MWLSAQRRRRFVLVLAIVTVATMVCGCNFLKAPSQVASHPITASNVPASALVVEVDTTEPATETLLPALIEATARPHEHLAVVGESGMVVSSIAPGPVSVPAPAAPAPLASGATTYEWAEHQHAMTSYRAAMVEGRREADERTQARLTAWVRGLPLGSVQGANSPVVGVLAQGGGTFASLEETGLHLGSRKALVLLGDGPGEAPTLSVSGLQGATIVVTGVVGNAAIVAGWQTALLATGAARTVVLGPATVDELTTVTRQGLGGSITDTLSDAALFQEGSATLLPGAEAELSKLARTLTVKYTEATVTIIGLCDPVGGATVDDPLSQQRALTVVSALEDFGVSANRLQPVGLGDADPAAPPGPGGVQPLDRRVLVVVQPGE